MTERAQSDLAVAVAALKAKQARYTRLWRYYDGDHPLVYTASRLKELFSNLDARFTANWASVVIDAVADRLAFQGWVVANSAEATTRLHALWSQLTMQLEADDSHKAALVCGEAFVIAWAAELSEAADEDAAASPVQLYYNDPRLCHVEYDAENPRVKAWAAKWWDVGGKRRLTLYYPDRLEYYISRGKATDSMTARAFIPLPEMPTAENPYGVVPVFHFRPERRMVKSDLTDVIPLQNGINKLLIDMMVAAEFGAFKQKYIIANADTSALKNAPNEIWNIPAADSLEQPTTVGEFSATDLHNYLDAIDRVAAAIGAITRTPRHYFFAQGGDPSGEALLALEAPLNKKAQDRIDRFAPEWVQVAVFLLKLLGTTVDPSQVQALYARPETVQPLTAAQTRQTSVAAGIPLTTVLRREGWSEQELAQMQQDKEAEQAQQKEALAASLARAQTLFNAGGDEQ